MLTFIKRRRFQLLAVLLVLMMAAGGAWYALVQTGYITFTSDRQPAPFPQPATTRNGRWEQDVDYLSSQLTYLHANAFHAVSEATFMQKADELRAQIPTLDDIQIIARMTELTALIQDAHTTAYIHEPGRFHLFPLSLGWYGNDLVVTAASPDFTDAIGARVVAIGNTPLLDAVERVAPFISHDNAQNLRIRAAMFLRTPEILYTAGILPDIDSGEFTFEKAEGEPFTLTFPAEAVDAGSERVTLYEVLNIETPLHRQNLDATYWYTYLEDSQTIYFQYNQCSDDPAQPFANFNAEMFAFIDANPVQRVVIDLRYNGGGNSSVLRPFIRAIRERSALNQPGGLYVLIGERTFSSAMMNAIELDDDTSAMLLGEPTGGRPNAYGETRTFTLPNSGLEIQYSTTYFRSRPGSDLDTVPPHVLIAPTYQDLLAGRDPVLEAAINGAGLQ
ncbi:MAG: hypothetical protein SF029_19275 [bacterium]|nr:hypothetical protein [bacterium]